MDRGQGTSDGAVDRLHIGTRYPFIAGLAIRKAGRLSPRCAAGTSPEPVRVRRGKRARRFDGACTVRNPSAAACAGRMTRKRQTASRIRCKTPVSRLARPVLRVITAINLNADFRISAGYGGRSQEFAVALYFPGREVALGVVGQRTLPRSAKVLRQLLRPALYETLRRELFRGETGGKSHAVVGRIGPGISVGQGVYRDRGSMGGKRQGSSGS